MTEEERAKKRQRKLKGLADLSRQVDKKYGESKWTKRGDDRAEYAQGIPGMVGSILDTKGSNAKYMRDSYKKDGFGGDTPTVKDIVKRIKKLKKDPDAGTNLTKKEKDFEKVHGGKSREMSKVRFKKRQEDNRKKRKAKKNIASK